MEEVGVGRMWAEPPALFLSLPRQRSDIPDEQQVPELVPFEHVGSHVGSHYTRDPSFIWARTQILPVRAQYSIPLISMHLLFLFKSICGASVPKICLLGEIYSVYCVYFAKGLLLVFSVIFRQSKW